LEPLEIANKIKEKFPEQVKDIKEFKGQVSVTLKKEKIIDICKWLYEEFEFDYLKDLCGVDYLGKKEVRFEVVYTLYSIKHHYMIRLKAEVDDKDPTIDSVINIWQGADWHERECYDMFGIIFKGHPDLRRILLPEDWEGHPLRKDYPAEGPREEWKGFQEVLDKAKELKEYQWQK